MNSVSIFISVIAICITTLKFIYSLFTDKEAKLDKLAKVADVDHRISIIKEDIKDIINDDIGAIDVKLEDHTAKISSLQLQAAVLSSQMVQLLKEVEKLDNKIDEWRLGD